LSKLLGIRSLAAFLQLELLRVYILNINLSNTINIYANLLNTRDLQGNKKAELAMGIISWIIFGLIAGILAKWIMPGKDGGGFIITVLLGVIGAVVGGWISTFFGFGRVDGFNVGSFVVAVIGALVVLFIYRKIRS
jgi:uncharacterized membrane protein YeaQ/YmgE (transglycosylase-associated protein family)